MLHIVISNTCKLAMLLQTMAVTDGPRPVWLPHAETARRGKVHVKLCRIS